MTKLTHGGELDSAVRLYGGRRDKWLDLSTCINQLPYPFMGVPRSDYSRLPDSNDYSACLEVARRAWSVDSGRIVFGSGSQSLIQILPYMFEPQEVAIVGFTYQEHLNCWSRAGHRVYVTDSPDTAESTSRIIIAVNPNNPDGRIWDDLYPLSRRLSMKGGTLIIDEAFCDLVPEISLAGSVDDHLVVLRSLGKFYGLAGLRFGAVICSDLLADRLEERLGPWSVSVPSLVAATKALSDSRWRVRTSKKLSFARGALEGVLRESGLSIVGGTDLFVLVEHPQAQKLSRHLAERHHILVRDFNERPHWLRFGVPFKRGRLNRLQRALAAFGD